jgi:uncharacterized protein (DUF433 family)
VNHEEATMKSKVRTLDIQEIPAYGLNELAEYLRISPKTVNYWASAGKSPLIRIPQISPPRFSFMNLVECHILSSIRCKGVALQKVRNALGYIKEQWPSEHPLISKLFQTDGVELFIENLPNELIAVSKGGQLAFKSILEAFLERIELSHGIAEKFYPFVAEKKSGEPKIIQIDPTISFGRPVIAGTGITTSIIASRFAARESITELAEEYGRKPEEIEEAIRWATTKAA